MKLAKLIRIHFIIYAFSCVFHSSLFAADSLNYDTILFIERISDDGTISRMKLIKGNTVLLSQGRATLTVKDESMILEAENCRTISSSTKETPQLSSSEKVRLKLPKDALIIVEDSYLIRKFTSANGKDGNSFTIANFRQQGHPPIFKSKNVMGPDMGKAIFLAVEASKKEVSE